MIPRSATWPAPTMRTPDGRVHDRRQDGACHEARQDSPAEVEMTYLVNRLFSSSRNAQIFAIRDDRLCRALVARARRKGLRGCARPGIGAADTRASRHGREEGAGAASASALGERPRPEIEIARSSASSAPCASNRWALSVDRRSAQKLADRHGRDTVRSGRAHDLAAPQSTVPGRLRAHELPNEAVSSTVASGSNARSHGRARVGRGPWR
jgi:hypothetical protein